VVIPRICGSGVADEVGDVRDPQLAGRPAIQLREPRNDDAKVEEPAEGVLLGDVVIKRYPVADRRGAAPATLAVGAGWRDLDLIVDNGDGSPMHPERLSRYFRELVRRLGVRVRLHDLRHAAVTVQLAAGVPLAIVSAVAGHASVSFTARQYGHMQPEHLRSAATAMAMAYDSGSTRAVSVD
jgi:hypothetical protein